MTTADEADVQAVLDLERRRCAAIEGAHEEALEAILAEDYLHVYGDGGVSDRRGYLAQIRRAPRRPTRGPLTVRLYGATAVLTGKLTNVVAYPGRPAEVFETFATQVAVKGPSGWRFVSFQITPRTRRPAPAAEGSP